LLPRKPTHNCGSLKIKCESNDTKIKAQISIASQVMYPNSSQRINQLPNPGYPSESLISPKTTLNPLNPLISQDYPLYLHIACFSWLADCVCGFLKLRVVAAKKFFSIASTPASKKQLNLTESKTYDGILTKNFLG